MPWDTPREQMTTHGTFHGRTIEMTLGSTHRMCHGVVYKTGGSPHSTAHIYVVHFHVGCTKDSVPSQGRVME